MNDYYGFCFRPSLDRDDCSGLLHLWVDNMGETSFLATSYDIRREEWDAVSGRLVMPDDDPDRRLVLMEYEKEMARDLELLEKIIRKLEGEEKEEAPDALFI